MDAAATPQGVRGRGRLTREAILDAYIELADREGRTDVSLRLLGDALGVDPTAVYRHFRDKSELLAAVANRLLARVVDAFEPTGDWRHDVRSLALKAREVYVSHPQLARLLAESPSLLPNNERLIEADLAAFRSAGLSDADAAQAAELLENYVAGVSSLNAVMGTAEDEAWRRQLAALPPTQFPHLTAVAGHLYRGDLENFEFGLDLILNALEALAGGRNQTPRDR